MPARITLPARCNNVTFLCAPTIDPANQVVARTGIRYILNALRHGLVTPPTEPPLAPECAVAQPLQPLSLRTTHPARHRNTKESSGAWSCTRTDMGMNHAGPTGPPRKLKWAPCIHWLPGSGRSRPRPDLPVYVGSLLPPYPLDECTTLRRCLLADPQGHTVPTSGRYVKRLSAPSSKR